MRVVDVAQVRQVPETRISADGRHVAFIVNEPSVADDTTKSRLMIDGRTVTTVDRATGIQWGPNNTLTFTAALDGADEIWSVPVTGGPPRKLFAAPVPAVPIGGQRLPFYNSRTPPHDAKVLQYAWSHDGRRLVFVTPQLTPAPSHGVVYDDKTLGVQSYTAGIYGTPRVGIWTYDAYTCQTKHLYDMDLGAQGSLGPAVGWSPKDERVETKFSGKTVVLDAQSGQVLDVPPTEPQQPPRLQTTDTFTAWSFAGQRAAAVRENYTTPPRVVLIDGQNVRDVHDPNPSYPVQTPIPTEWTDVHGHKATGYRIVPPACEHTRCPAVVITHGGDAQANRFMWDGFEWEFPTQVLAAKGYVVLAVSEAQLPPSPPNDWPATLRDLLDPVAMAEAAVQSGVDAGYVDPTRVGIAGYSRGAEVAELAIAHSTMFKAASVAEGGSGTVGYWILGAQNPYAIEGAKEIFGGSPVDPKAADRWRDFAADLRADHINTPLLIQAAENNSLANMELRSYLRARDVPVELVSYPGESHIFHQVGDRVAAMNRSLDWFDHWLLDKKNPENGRTP